MQFYCESMRELESTGASIQDFAHNDPVGLLWHLGVLCVPSDTEVHLSNDLHLLHEHAQQMYSIQILEEDAALEEPVLAAIALLEWIGDMQHARPGAQADGLCHELDAMLNLVIQRKARPVSPTTSGCSGHSPVFEVPLVQG